MTLVPVVVVKSIKNAVIDKYWNIVICLIRGQEINSLAFFLYMYVLLLKNIYYFCAIC